MDDNDSKKAKAIVFDDDDDDDDDKHVRSDSDSDEECPFIPGLVREAYIPGSWHTATTPALIRSRIVKGSVVDFEWRAVGSSVYSVTAKGEVKLLAGTDSTDKPIFDANSFKVVCTCPDGDRQKEQSKSSNKLYVCKHGKASLDSVLDTATIVEIQAKLKAAASLRGKFFKEQREVQEREMPGERERIQYGLSKRSDADIVSMVKDACATVEGLEALTKVFPKEVMLPRQIVVCGRCKKKYDPQIFSDLVCREEHPPGRSFTQWEGSKKSWENCERFGKDFGLNGFSSYGKRYRDEPDDEGLYCYETTHVPQAEYDANNDPIIQEIFTKNFSVDNSY